MAPACQCLEPDDAAIRPELRLIMQQDRPGLYGLAQMSAQVETFALALLLGKVKHPDAAAPFGLGETQGRIGGVEQSGFAVAVLGEAGAAHADAHRVTGRSIDEIR